MGRLSPQQLTAKPAVRPDAPLPNGLAWMFCTWVSQDTLYLINTPLQRGEAGHQEIANRFNGLTHYAKTVVTSKMRELTSRHAGKPVKSRVLSFDYLQIGLFAGMARRFECVNFSPRQHERLPVMIISRQLQGVPTPAPNQFGGQHQKVCAQALQRGRQIFRWQAEPLESVHQIESQQQELKKRHIGYPIICGNLSQRIIIQQLPDVFLDIGPLHIKPPQSVRSQSQVRDHRLIRIPAIFQEHQLGGFIGVFGEQTANGHKAPGLFPALALILEFSYADPVGSPRKSEAQHFATQGRIHFGHDDVAAALGFQVADELRSPQAEVCPNADPRAGPSRRKLGQTSPHEVDHAGVGRTIARAKRAMPKLLACGFKTQQGMIGAPSLLLGIVAQTRSLLFAVDSHHDRVQVEEQTAGGRGNLEPLQAQAIMQANQLANSAGRKGFKKSSQPGLIRKAIQAQQIEECPVVLENFGFVDPPQPRNHGVEQGQEQIRGPVFDAPQTRLHISLQEPTQADLLTKALDQHHAAEVGETRLAEFKLPSPWACGHKQKAQKPALRQLFTQQVKTCRSTFYAAKP